MKINPESTKAFRDLIINKSKNGTYRLRISLGNNNYPIDVDSDVFPPQNELILCNYIKDLNDNLSDLNIADIGTGTGVESILIAHMGAKHIDAVDINALAIKCATHNAELNNITDKISFYCSDLFHELGLTKYDIIFANLPFIDFDVMSSPLDIALYDSGYIVHNNFFSQAKSHLTNNGFILLPHANLQSGDTKNPKKDFEIMEKMITEEGYKFEIIASKPYRTTYMWQVYKINIL